MESQEQNSAKETLRKENLKAEESKSLVKDQERARVYLAREQKIESGQKIKENRRADDLASETIKQDAKEKARKEAYLAREQQIAREQEARKLKK
jgi:hypothetical protein